MSELHPSPLAELKELRAKCTWQAEMLERAVVMATDYEYGKNDWAVWLSDLEKGPSDDQA